MGVLSRLASLAVVSALLMFTPVSAQAPPPDDPCAKDPACDPCQQSPCGGNATAPPSNSTAGNGTGGGSTAPPTGGPMNTLYEVAGQVPGGRCDVVRPTGTRPYASINPVLGILTVNAQCIIRLVKASATVSGTGLPL